MHNHFKSENKIVGNRTKCTIVPLKRFFRKNKQFVVFHALERALNHKITKNTQFIICIELFHNFFS